MENLREREVSVYIVRHGECLANVAQKFMDPFEDVLTDVGKAQAELLGDMLKSIPFTHVFASNYPRADETCRKILAQSEHCKDVEMKSDQRIRERDCTGIVGEKAMDAMTILKDSMQSGTHYFNVEMPKSETVEEFERRIQSFFNDLIKTLQEDGGASPVLVVSHGMTIQRLMNLLNQHPETMGVESWRRNVYSAKLMRNTSYHKLILKFPEDKQGLPSGWVELAHCRDHVDTNFTNATATNQTEKVKVSTSAFAPTDIQDGSTNYKYLQENKADANTEEQIVQYCHPA